MRGVKVWVKTEREGEIGRGDKGRGVLWGVEPCSSPQGTAPSGTAQQQERRFGPFQLARLIGLTKNKPVSKWEPALVAEYPLRWRAGLPLAGKNKWEGYIKRMMSGTECIPSQAPRWWWARVSPIHPVDLLWLVGGTVRGVTRITLHWLPPIVSTGKPLPSPPRWSHVLPITDNANHHPG